MGFLTDLAIEILPRKRGMWRVSKPLLYLDQQGRTWEVPPGTETDGASIPRAFWRVIGHPLSWEFADCAVLHDWLYQSQEVSRKDADRIFREALAGRRVAGWRRWSMWSAVRLFGRWSWDRTVWAIILMLGVLCLATGCKSTRVEMRNGKPWTVETREIAGVVLSTEEYPQQTQWQIGMARVGSLVPRGGWLITIGAVASIAGLLVGLYTTAPAVHHISSIVILAGGALIGAGLLLIGIGMLGAYGILAACVCMAVGAVYYFRKHKYERAI